jgi:REP element-mobilizing transposase RayT
MGNKRISLEPDKYYHIYNHAVVNSQLFKQHDNYFFFLKKLVQHICPVADMFAYCLMPNHFHMALRIKSRDELKEFWGLKDLTEEPISKKLSHQFGNLFNSYTKAFNKQNSRVGNLFLPNFERKLINNDEYFKKLIHYIHFNPVHHGFVTDLRDWKYSSFESFFSDKSTHLKRDEVIAWFFDKQNFFDFHKQEIDSKMVLELEV